jgi:hypothetical protein
VSGAGRLPDFLVIGVPKAGTTALHAALAQHPDLYLSAVKEPKFFLTDGPPPTHGGPGDVQTYQEHVWRRKDYEALFAAAPAGAQAGEATPFYLHDLAAHQRIQRLIPQAKLIVFIRNPVDRAHSNWAHLWGAGLEPEHDFVRACEAEDARRAAGWAAFWHYLALGRYGEQLQALFTRFDREQVLVMRYRELRDSPAATLDRVCGFLGVRTGLLDTVPSENVRPYVADTGANAVLRALLRTGGTVGQHFPVIARKAVRGPLLTLLHRQTGVRPRLTTAQRAAVLPHFVQDIGLLGRLTGESYEDWLVVDDQAMAGGAQ